MPSTRSALVVVLLAAGTWVVSAQSQNPFGQPSADKPQPAADIKAVPGSRAQGWLSQGRSEVVARHGIVATSDPLAAQAGLDILRQGGNAIDAAVATGAMLDVTSQNDTGIGGDLFAIVWVAKEKKLYALSAAGWAPAGWTPEFFAKLGEKRVPGSGVNAATVPGAIAGYDALLTRFGTMGFKETFEPAARAAEQGWGLAERRHNDLRGSGEGPARRSRFERHVPRRRQRAGALQHHPQSQPGQGAAADPGAGQGRLLQGRDRRRHRRQGAGQQGRDDASEDLAEFAPEWVEPVTTNYHGYDIFQLPPPGQGFAALEMLNILEVCVPKLGFNLTTLGPSDPMKWHLMVEAKKLAYADLQAKNGDPKFATVPVRAAPLQGVRRHAVRQDRSRTRRAAPAVPGGTDGGTIYLTTADRWGNMVSLVHSVFSVYGSRATVGPYGFVLHNRGSAFSLDPKSPNVVAPHKRPFHSIIAGFVMKDGAPLMAFGNMGGSVQPETHAQHMVNVIDHGMNVQMTTDAARFTHNQNSNMLSLEHEPVRAGRRGARGQGPQRARGGRRLRGRLPGHPVHARPAAAGAGVRSAQRHRGSAGERRLPRRIGPSQGRAGGGLVGSRFSERREQRPARSAPARPDRGATMALA